MAYVTPVLTGSFQFMLHCEEMFLPNTTLCAKCLVIFAVESASVSIAFSYTALKVLLKS